MTDTDMDSLPDETGTRYTLKRYVGANGVIMIMLMLLAIIGVGITDYSPRLSHLYWLAMVLVTGISCNVIEWSCARKKGLSATTIVKKEMLIWLSVLVAVSLVYFLFHSGRLDNENTGLIILLILALATFLAGLRLGWWLPRQAFIYWRGTNPTLRTGTSKRVFGPTIVSRAMAISNRRSVAITGKNMVKDKSIKFYQADEGG